MLLDEETRKYLELLASATPGDVTDWAWMELRDAYDGGVVDGQILLARKILGTDKE